MTDRTATDCIGAHPVHALPGNPIAERLAAAIRNGDERLGCWAVHGLPDKLLVEDLDTGKRWPITLGEPW